MTSNKLQAKESNGKYGFVNQEGAWVIHPIYNGEDIYDDKPWLLLETENDEEESEHHLVFDDGQVVNLSAKGFGETEWYDEEKGILKFDVDGWQGLYSSQFQKIILPPISREFGDAIDENGFIFFLADGDEIAKAFKYEENVNEKNDFGYIDISGNFITNRGYILKKLISDCFIMETAGDWGSPSETILHSLVEVGDNQNSDLVSDIYSWSVDVSGKYVYVCYSNERKEGIYDLVNAKWQVSPVEYKYERQFEDEYYYSWFTSIAGHLKSCQMRLSQQIREYNYGLPQAQQEKFVTAQKTWAEQYKEPVMYAFENNAFVYGGYSQVSVFFEYMQKVKDRMVFMEGMLYACQVH